MMEIKLRIRTEKQPVILTTKNNWRERESERESDGND